MRLFSNIDRAVVTLLTLIAIATGPYWWSHLRLSATIIEDLRAGGVAQWALTVSGGVIAFLRWSGIAAVGLLLLQPLFAFKSDPEKLMKDASQSVWRTLREFLTLPSLIGKSDVRQEFAANLKDVVEALNPQRLVIFLDDLDRCRPEQVVQILEAVNFLSSVSSCFIFIGADYRKVEALAAKEFEEIAVEEEENKRVDGEGTPAASTPVDKVALRVKYARSYMKKIVNLRINLKRLQAADYREFLRRKPEGAKRRVGLMQRVMMVTALVAIVSCYVVVRMYPPMNEEAVQRGVKAAPLAQEKAAVPAAGGASGGQSGGGPAAKALGEIPAAPSGQAFDRDKIGFEGKWWAIGISSAIAAVFLVYWFGRPKRQAEAQDPTTFAVALEDRSEDILKEVRDAAGGAAVPELFAAGGGTER